MAEYENGDASSGKEFEFVYKPQYPVPPIMRVRRPLLSLEPLPKDLINSLRYGEMARQVFGEHADPESSCSGRTSLASFVEPVTQQGSSKMRLNTVNDHVQMYRDPSRIKMSSNAACKLLLDLAEGKPVVKHCSYLNGVSQLRYLAEAYIESIPPPTSHRCAKDPAVMRNIATAAFKDHAELFAGISLVQSSVMGSIYSSGPGDVEAVPWYNLMVPLASGELATTNKGAPSQSLLQRIREEAQHAAYSSVFFSSTVVKLAALVCSDTAGELDVVPASPGTETFSETLLYVGLVWRGIDAGAFINANCWPTCPDFDFSDALGFSLITYIPNDIIGLAHDVTMGDWANSFLISGATGKPSSPTAEMLSIYVAFNRVAHLPTPVREYYMRYWLTFIVLHLLSLRYCALYFAEETPRTTSNFVTQQDAFTNKDLRKPPIKECHRTLLGLVSEQLLKTVRSRLSNPQEWPTLLSECFDYGGRGDMSLLAATAVVGDLETGVLYGLAINAELVLPKAELTTISIMERVAVGHRNNVSY